ncbi:MAG: PP2C family protein-serine/threonine phosphatase [Candidatus Sumerlaeia bacterium]
MQNLRVLVVDDEADVRFPLQEFFKHRGDECVLARDGLEGLDFLKQCDFHIMVTDISMPRMDGLQLVAEARKIRPQMVCLVLSGTGTRADIIMALQSGAFDFLEKPLPDYATFSMVIDRAAERCWLIRDRDKLLADLKKQNARLEVSLDQLHEAYGRLRQQEETLETDLRQAQRVQRKMLPQGFPVMKHWNFYAYYAPCERLGGDFFGTVPISDDKFAIYLGDVAGHGVSAAMITVVLRELVHAHRFLYPESRVFEKPEAAMAFLNRGLLEEMFDPPILATIVYCIYDGKEGTVTCSCAGHPPPILVHENGKARALEAEGPVLGIESPSDYKTDSVKMKAGDFLLFYTDGLPESRNRMGIELTEAGLMKSIWEMHGAPSRDVGEELENKMLHFLSGLTPADDMTFIVSSCMDGLSDDRPAQADGLVQDSVKFVLPEDFRRVQPAARGAIAGGWTNNHFAIRIEGLGSWQLAPRLRDLFQEALNKKAEKINLDMHECQALDSTMLGLMFQLAPSITMNRPTSRVREQLDEMKILDRFTISEEAVDLPEKRVQLRSSLSQSDYSDLMITAHEALMGVSEENRNRFQKVVDGLKEKKAKKNKG